MDEPITRFSGKWEALSNFSAHPVRWDGTNYPTVEHAFQAAKTIQFEWKMRIAAAPTPRQAKRIGRKAPMRIDWDGIKVNVMRRIVTAKMAQNPDARRVLMSTGTRPLFEGNTWGDRFWGVDEHGEGANHLGIILMDIRAKLAREGKA